MKIVLSKCASKFFVCWLAVLAFAGFACESIAEVPSSVLEAEASRIEVVQRISQHTVAIFDRRGEGGGSGVLISADGYALTNFHVTAPCGTAMKCGLADGKLYDAVIVGIDPPGDVALIKLLGRDDFPAAELGDSDAARVGDWVIVAGNPFLLADDYTPTITYGILSGTHRYQYPAGTLLEYADCLQTDASINPGNSGGPLFDASGKVIGINGRGSFEKRGRVNVGVGYAISINQIKLFLSHLRAGRVVDHATLGATVSSVAGGRVVVDDVLQDSDAYRRGMRYGDYLISFGSREIHTANAFKNALGIYPARWSVPVEFRRDDATFSETVQLKTLHATGELEALIDSESRRQTPIEPPSPKKEGDQPKDGENDKDAEPTPAVKLKPAGDLPKIVKQHFEKRAGFANYWFNRQHQQRVAEACRQFGAVKANLPLILEGRDSDRQRIFLKCFEREAEYRSSRGQFYAELNRTLDETVGPPGSGGLLAAAEAWRQLISRGIPSFGEAYYFGQLPFGDNLKLHDSLLAYYRGAEVFFYFNQESGDLVGMELFAADGMDPCRVNFSDFRDAPNGRLPRQWKVEFDGKVYVKFEVDDYRQGQKTTTGAP